MLRFNLFLGVSTVVLLSFGIGMHHVAGGDNTRSSIGQSTDGQKALIVRPGLHSVLRVSDRVYCGSGPEVSSGFASLQAMDVKTIVSVDGLPPRIDTAQQHGLRYIHIPLGYGGVSRAAGDSLARVAREVGGIIYVHCHHGKHRGPAAAAIVCRVDGTADRERSLEILRQAGTSPAYSGLWRDVAVFTPPTNSAVLPKLVEIADVEPLVGTMAVLSRHFEMLSQAHASHWQSTGNRQPRLVVEDALLVRELFQEIARAAADPNHTATAPPPALANCPHGNVEVAEKPVRPKADHDDRYREWMTEAAATSLALHESLVAGNHAIASKEFQRLTRQCHQCHAALRN